MYQTFEVSIIAAAFTCLATNSLLYKVLDNFNNKTRMARQEVLHFSSAARALVDPYLPLSLHHDAAASATSRAHVTLTYACSLDSQIANSPGAPTVLSGPASKSMTHYLRTKHDAILVGSGTAIADDPGLNSRLGDAVESGLGLQPRPIVLDRRARWDINSNSKVIRTAREGRGKAPYIVVGADILPTVSQDRRHIVERYGGEYIACSDFVNLLQLLEDRGIQSVMVEGGGQIINTLLSNHGDVVDSVIVTVAPVYLGQGGVVVCPQKDKLSISQPAVKFRDVRWLPLDDDVVMCARIKQGC